MAEVGAPTHAVRVGATMVPAGPSPGPGPDQEATLQPDDGPGCGSRGTGPFTWIVIWGVLARPGFEVEHVIAWDADEALVTAAERRPDLPRPTVAVLAS